MCSRCVIVLLLAPLEKVKFVITVLAERGHDTTRIDSDDNDSEEEEEEEDDNDFQWETEKLPTISSRGIFSSIINDEICDAVEDDLLTDPSIQASDTNTNAVVLALLNTAAEKPTKSYLAKLTPSALGVYAYSLANSETNLRRCIEVQKNILEQRNVHVQSIQYNDLPKARKECDEAQKLFYAKADILASHENQLAEHHVDGLKENKELKDKERDLKALSILQTALGELHNLHLPYQNPENLPYSKIKTDEDVQRLASLFGVTTIESILKLTQKEHINVAKACDLFGYKLSPAFMRTGLTVIKYGNYTMEILKEQTAKLFLLHNPFQERKRGQDILNSPSPKKKKARMSSAMKAVKKKWCRTPTK